MSFNYTKTVISYQSTRQQTHITKMLYQLLFCLMAQQLVFSIPTYRVETTTVDDPAPTTLVIGNFTSRAHSVSSGDVTVLDDRRISIRSFTYDGQGPDAYFYVGVSDRVQRQVKPYGIIADENGVSDRKISAYNGKDIILTLPSSISTVDLKWLAVYCVLYEHNFGEVTFPDNVVVLPSVNISSGTSTSAVDNNGTTPTPTTLVIGNFTRRAHFVSSGDVTVLDNKRISIRSFTYDGQGPDAFFYVGVSDRVQPQQKPYGIIPDENGVSDRRISAYLREDIILTLPDDVSAVDLKWLAVYDVTFLFNFGEVKFPDNLELFLLP